MTTLFVSIMPVWTQFILLATLGIVIFVIFLQEIKENICSKNDKKILPK